MLTALELFGVKRMGGVLFVMAILGCGDAGSQCETVRMNPTTYATAEACQAAMPLELERSTDLPYPSISADCQKKPSSPRAQRVLPRK